MSKFEPLFRWFFPGRYAAGDKPRSLDSGDMPIKLPASYIEAAQSLTDWEAFKDAGVKSRLQSTEFEGLNPLLSDFLRAFLKELHRRGIPMYCFETVRSVERQAMLKEQGVSLAGPGESPHQDGLAFDLVSATKYWGLTNKQWEVIGAIGFEVARKRGVEVDWGGNWGFYDPAHWQLTGWRHWRLYKAGKPWPQSLHQQADRLAYLRGFKKWLKSAS